MSLKSRLDSVQASMANNGCRTCMWLDTLSTADRRAFDSWLDESKSIAQLWELCVLEGVGVTQSPFRYHLKHHERVE